MVERKIFAGPRVRRIRMGLGLTQTTMAQALDISPSYLNLIERNQRPLTVQLLLKLSSVYKVDLDELQGEQGGNAGQLREVFADPLLAGEIPGDQELIEFAEAAPNAANGMIRLYRAYREQAARLSDLAELLSREGRVAEVAGPRLPLDEVHDRLQSRPNFFARIEDAAEAFHERLSVGDDMAGALKAWLKGEHGIAVRLLPVRAMPVRAPVTLRSIAGDCNRGLAPGAARGDRRRADNPCSLHARSQPYRSFRAGALCLACASYAVWRLSLGSTAPELRYRSPLCPLRRFL